MIMKKKYTILFIVLGFLLACSIGLSYNYTQSAADRQMKEESERIEKVIGMPVQFLQTDQSVNCNVYGTDSYEFQVNRFFGTLEEISIIPDADLKDTDQLISAEPDQDAVYRKSLDLYQGFINNTDPSNLKTETKYDEELGYTCTISEVDGEYLTGNKLIAEYDPDGILIAAVLMHDEGTDYNVFSVSVEDALQTALEEAEAATLAGELDGSKTAEKFKYKYETHEVDRWNGATYYCFKLYADVTFSDWGVVEKMYEVRVDANTGLVYDCAWSLN